MTKRQNFWAAWGVVATMLLIAMVVFMMMPESQVTVVAATPGPDVLSSRNVRVYHDVERGVTCWAYYSPGGIACLPDSTFEKGE